MREYNSAIKYKVREHSFLMAILFFAVSFFFSCGRPLESVPLENLSLGEVFDVKDSAGVYALDAMKQAYTYMPDGFYGVNFSLLTDDAIPSDKSSTMWGFVNNGFSIFSSPDDLWAQMYKGIRYTTICYNNVGRVPFQNHALADYFVGEAQFLRAFYYFQLVKRFGGVPLLGNVVRTQDDDLSIPRSSFKESVDYIVSELDSAFQKLRPEPVAPGDLGKASKGWALALKAKVLLYAASPLNNPENDPVLWQKAADAAKALIDTHYYNLENNFGDIFVKDQIRELIVFKKLSNGNTIEATNGPVGYLNVGGNGAATSPTQELVEAFGMKSGLALSDPVSGYNAADPYINRDPRFYLTILYNGAQWLKRAVETYEGGLDKPNSSLVQTQTGYYMRKFMGNFENEAKYAAHPRSAIYIRYAEILLDYAEALNESAGPVSDVYDQLIALRKRAGIDAGIDGMYGLKTGMAQSEMRDVIRNERRVELAFEGQRFFDIRRWKIAEDVYTIPLHGIRMTISPGTGELTSQTIPVVTPFFEPKMYRFPIPYDVLVASDGLEQDPAWK